MSWLLKSNDSFNNLVTTVFISLVILYENHFLIGN
jgi:hypothetical protein